MSFIRMMVKGAKEESKSGFTVIKWGGEGDFIVISRTFFFYPNLVWILNFLFFKENFLIIKQPPPHTSSFVGGGFRLVWGESVHIHTRSINLISGQVFFVGMESIYLLWGRINLDTPKLIQLMKYWVVWSWWTFSHRIDWPDTNSSLIMNWRVEAGC